MKPVLIAVLALTFAVPAWADDVSQGRETFERYCASCHGNEATGQGPMQPVLTLQPANLTRLSAKNDGKFPLIRVIKRIDGRDPLVAHGSPMPVYGDFFEGDDVTIKAPSGQPIMTSRPVAELVAYLVSLQTHAD